MYKRILESAGDINIIALIALIIFFIFFVITCYRVITAKKGFIDKMAGMPLDGETTNS